MTDTPQRVIYCCVAPEVSDDVSDLLERMRGADYRVLVGNDPDELLLLLELSRPEALLYTLETEASELSSGFRVIERRALEQGLPLIVVRPKEPASGGLESALWLPRDSRFEKIAVGAHDLLGRLEEQGSPQSFVAPESGAAKGDDEGLFGEELRDFVEDGERVIEVETRLVSQGPPRIRTTISSQDGLLLQEDQPADPLDADLASKVEAQHMLALAVYRTRGKENVGGVESAYHGEISEPIVLPEVSATQERKRREPDSAVLPLVLLGAGAVAGLLVAMFVMIAPTLNRPKVVERPGLSDTRAGQPQPGARAGFRDGRGAEYLFWPPYASDTGDDTATESEGPVGR